MGGAAPLAALGQESDISASRRSGLALGLAQNLHSGPGVQDVVASVEARAAHDAQLRDGVGELREADAGLALAGVDAHGLLAVGGSRVHGDTGWDDGRALVGQDVGGAVADVSRGAVDVEDAAGGGSGVIHEHSEGLASTGVVRGQDEVVDRGGMVVGRDVGH